MVFDVLTKPEHVHHWFAPFGCVMKECSIDLRVGGTYRQVFVAEDGTECAFGGTYLEIERPRRTVETWQFEGWPGVETIETVQLSEADGVTTLAMTVAFKDQGGRDHMTMFDGQASSFDKLEDHLLALLA